MPIEDCTKSPSKIPTQRKSERLHIPRAIPETPEEKLRPAVRETEVEVVKATPAAKMCGNPSRHKSKMSELVRISEERTRIPRAAALASAKASKAIIQASQCTGPISRESLLGLNNLRSKRAKSNLLKKFANIANNNNNNNTSKDEDKGEKPTRVLRSASLVQNVPVKPLADVKPITSEPPEKKNRPAPPSVPIQMPPVGIDDIVGPEQFARFQQRVNEINKLSNLDDNQVYCEEVVRRTSLFDEEVVSPCGKNLQRNRTRRVVTASSAAHLAHTLLNVDNGTPLEVWKLPKSLSSPEKMPRMIRTGVNAIKMKKIQRMREQSGVSSPSDNQKPDSLAETE